MLRRIIVPTTVGAITAAGCGDSDTRSADAAPAPQTVAGEDLQQEQPDGRDCPEKDGDGGGSAPEETPTPDASGSGTAL